MATSTDQEHIINVEGSKFRVRCENPAKLHEASEWLQKRVLALSEKHLQLKPSELHLLLLLELATERIDFIENGKALLKETGELVEWLGSQKTL